MSEPKLHLDIETYSECDLGSAGVYRYAEHPSTEILCFSYKFSDDPQATWSWRPGRPLPARVVQHIQQGGEIRAHNAQFERVVLNGVAGEKIGFPKILIEQTVCTAAKMAAHGLPRALGAAAEALGASPKSIEGKIVMLQLCKPRKKHEDGRYTPANAFEKFKILYEYCDGDVEAETDIDARVPDLSAAEQAVYVLDQKINARGWAVDLEAVANIKAVIEQYKEFLAAEMQRIVGVAPTQRAKIADWIRTHGYPGLMDMQAETVKQLAKNPNVPAEIKRVLAIYNTYNMKAVAKYDAILDAVCADGRLRGMFLFLGAGTGRWSSLIVQLQNLFRPLIDDPETAVAAFAARDLDWIRALYAIDPMKVAASCVRSVLIAGPRKDLLFPDFVGIESRGNAWLFDEEWKLEVFRKQDAKTGPDSYAVAYARAFNVLVSEITKKDPRRQIGKVMELALGYEGGAGAFVTMVATYGIDLVAMTKTVLPIIPEDVRESADWMWHNMPQTRNELDYDTFIACDSLKRMWRTMHPKIVQGWKDLKAAAEQAVQFPGRVFEIPNGKIKFKVADGWLYMRLPSGRRLAYYKPRWVEPREGTRFVNGRSEVYTVPGEMRYWGIDTYTRQWVEQSTYGGKLCENAVQALSRDLLVNAMFKLEESGAPIIGTVHDEIICEIDEGADGPFEEAARQMCDLPKWAAGLPVAVDGHVAKRYRK